MNFSFSFNFVRLADTLPLLVWGCVENLPVPMTILQERLQLERSKVEQVQIWVVGRSWGHIERFMSPNLVTFLIHSNGLVTSRLNYWNFWAVNF